MAVSYHKDFSKNYIVFDEHQWKKEEDFCYQMLCYNKIEGVLPVEKRTIDNKVQLYYDITGKQSLLSWMERSVYDYEKIKQLYKDLILIIEESRKYLLCEDNFMVSTEHIYVDIITGQAHLCYGMGYHCPIIEQMSRLTEYFMDKVNYSNKESVYLIYQLHGIGKEQGFTLNHMKQLLYQEKHELENRDKGINQINDLRNDQRNVEANTKDNKTVNTPVNVPRNKGLNNQNSHSRHNQENCAKKQENTRMEQLQAQRRSIKEYGQPINPAVETLFEKVESEVERYYYPLRTYLITGVLLLVSVGIIIYAISSGFFYNPYGKRIDFVKLVAVLLVILSLGSYVLTKVWNKGNRLTKIESKEEIIQIKQPNNISKSRVSERLISVNPSSVNLVSKNLISENPLSENPISENRISESYLPERNNINAPIIREEQDENPTCLLNGVVRDDIFRLKQIGSDGAESVAVHKTPFFIGKRKGNVDYWIDQEGVSRYHAKITKEEGEYYITDLNSMNGTYVNENLVGIYEKKKINNGDLISIATCRYLWEQLH